MFDHGDTEVVDSAEMPREPALCSLLDFVDGRKVDHVRLVAEAVSGTATVALGLVR